MTDWEIPVKCSVVRSFDSRIRKLNWDLFKIFCAVSSLYCILVFTHIVNFNMSTDNAFIGIYLVSWAIGLGVSITIITVSIIEFTVGFIRAISNHLPNIKCIED